MGQNNSTGLPGQLRTRSASPTQPQQELDSFHEERSGSPQTSASSASESTIPNSPPQKRMRTAKGESSQSPEEDSEYLGGDNGVRFHIHPRDEIKICDRFLLGGCTQGDSCPLHHTHYPYHWQIRRRDSKAWQSVSESAQRHLEKLYCDTGKEQIKFVDKGGAVGSIFLHSMKLVCFVGPYDKVRRLSNTSDPKENPHFPTEWAAYWKSNDNWKKYEEPISQGLLAAYEQDKDSYTFERQGHFFTVDLKRRVQWNRDKGYVRLVQRRPSYRPLLSMVPHLMTLPRRPWGTVPSTSDVLGENPKDGYCGSYPVAWVPKPPDGQAFLKMEVLPTEVAYHRVCALFHQSVSEEKTLVLGIYRIRNDDLWEKYTRKKAIMSHACSLQEKHQLEKHLFYGSAADFLEPICQNNFDPSFSRLHAPIYGRGCYFSKSAIYSHRHGQASKAGLRYMFLAKVLVGKTAVGHKLFRHPLPVVPGGQLFNSWVNSRSNTQVYVISDNCQCYPYFLISYKMLSDPVAVDG
ncbi:protein mono-ADP-ribosyltransferase TIPARP-like [Chelonia mydas]|uniref:protein mono-ADP-ribosyltransferase TIPARP-like n=1 Tax=Chelonia mydas TaxID=8469 RepID=UPI001CA94DA4|nr:protein mono-ADP-ribosyltransferase TIPARP-like [Chelonia mydas]